MSWISEPDPNATSPFALMPMPSSALIDKLLREVDDVPGLSLDENAVKTYGQRLFQSARLLQDSTLTSSPVDRTESFHYLLLMTAYAVEAAITNHDPLEPMWSAPGQFHLLDWGAASPDGVYRRAMVREDLSYRVWGRLGNASYFSMDSRLSKPMVTIVRSDLELDADGNFEIFIGGEQRDRQWWPLHPGTVGLTTREFFDDWSRAERSILRIECLDGKAAPRVEYNAARVAAEFDVVSDWILEAAIRFWIKKSTELEEVASNAFHPELGRKETKLPVVATGIWRLAAEEALIIEVPDPHADFWAFQLASSLWHTLDYANRFTSINQFQAIPDSDGVFRVVLSHRDPGVHNWLEAMDLERGIIILRLCGARDASVPTTRVMKVEDVHRALAQSAPCSPDERRKQLTERREGVSRMVCD